ncbi:MAG: hypothetical protein JWQ78_1258 [Sediminibacterium sp.]|nr:hypothetical protein [Sediminibacterium sp.]
MAQQGRFVVCSLWSVVLFEKTINNYRPQTTDYKPSLRYHLHPLNILNKHNNLFAPVHEYK